MFDKHSFILVSKWKNYSNKLCVGVTNISENDYDIGTANIFAYNINND